MNNNNNSTRRRRDLPTTRPSSPGRYSPGARTNDVPPDPEEEEEGPCRECEEGSDGCVGEGEEEEERTTAPLNPTEYEPIPMETLVPSVVSGDVNGDVDVDVDVDANISVNAHANAYANANANVNASVDFNVNVDVDVDVDIGDDLVDYDYDEIRYRLLQEEEDDRREWLEHHIFARDDVPGDSDEDGDAFNDRSWEFHDEQMRLFWEEYPDEYDDDDEHDHYNGNGDHNDNDNDDDNDDERWHGHGYSMVEQQQQQQQQQQLPPVSQSSQLRGDVVGNDSDSDHHEDDLWSFPNELLREPQMKALVEECETRDKAATTGRSNSGASARARARDNNNNNGNYDNNIDNDDGDDNDDDDDDCPPSWTSRCVVCLEQSATHAMVPCGHLCLCAECTVRSFSKAICGTPSCPVCRQPLSMVLRIFVP